jgi:ribosome-binding protein aMBF1 (putative translation factor)
MQGYIRNVDQSSAMPAARGLRGWSQSDLSEASKTVTKTIADFERGAIEPYARALGDVQSALEKAGVEFIAENGGGPGVRLRKSGSVRRQSCY